jgi:hypothetical protein
MSQLIFRLEQIAICPRDPVAAKDLLAAMGIGEWANDHVIAEGSVFGMQSANHADLSFNYDIFAGKEFEVLNYTDGDNWMKHGGRPNSVSHLGMHCTTDELIQWREFFAGRNIHVAQEVFTKSHTNPVIAGKRSYNYVIFNTKEILGVDLKFIVRIDVEQEKPLAEEEETGAE